MLETGLSGTILAVGHLGSTGWVYWILSLLLRSERSRRSGWGPSFGTATGPSSGTTPGTYFLPPHSSGTESGVEVRQGLRLHGPADEGDPGVAPKRAGSQGQLQVQPRLPQIQVRRWSVLPFMGQCRNHRTFHQLSGQTTSHPR